MINYFEESDIAESHFDEMQEQFEVDEFLFANENAVAFNEADEEQKNGLWNKLKEFLKKIKDTVISMFDIKKNFGKALENAKSWIQNIQATHKNNQLNKIIELQFSTPHGDMKFMNALKEFDKPRQSLGKAITEKVKVTWSWVLGRFKQFGNLIQSLNPFKQHAEKSIQDAQSKIIS